MNWQRRWKLVAIGVGEGRTKLRQLRYRSNDYLALGVSSVFMVLVAWFF